MKHIIALSLLFCMGCATIQPLTPADNKRLEDEFNRAHENPVPPGLLIPRR